MLLLSLSICAPHVFCDIWEVKFRSKRAIFRVIWGGFEGFGPCLGMSRPTHPHLGEISKQNVFYAFPDYRGAHSWDGTCVCVGLHFWSTRVWHCCSISVRYFVTLDKIGNTQYLAFLANLHYLALSFITGFAFFPRSDFVTGVLTSLFCLPF